MYRSLESPRDWTEHMIEMLTTQGVPLVGVSTKETLAGGPPSTDLEYVLLFEVEALHLLGIKTLRCLHLPHFSLIDGARAHLARRPASTFPSKPLGLRLTLPRAPGPTVLTHQAAAAPAPSSAAS